MHDRALKRLTLPCSRPHGIDPFRKLSGNRLKIEVIGGDSEQLSAPAPRDDFSRE